MSSSSALARRPAQPSNAGAGLITKSGSPMPASNSYLQQQAEAERHHRLDRAWKWYTGDISGHFRPEPGQPDVNVITNRASTIVDTGVDFLYGKCVTFEALLNGKPQPKAQDALDGCWGNEDRRMTLLSKLAQNGGIFGHVFAKIIPPSDDRKYCRVIVLDPAQVSVVTDPDDCDTVLAYIVDWQVTPTGMGGSMSAVQQQLGSIVGKRQVILRCDPDDPDLSEDNNDAYSLDPDATWEISTWLRGPNNTWYQQGEPIAWEHQWAPVVDWQNLPLANSHWGMSDIPPNVQHLNSVLNLALSNVNAIAKHHSFPWLYASGVGLGATIELAPGKITQLQAPEGKLAAVEAHGDLAGLMAFAGDLRSDMDEQTRVPGVATGRFTDLPKATSGVALQMLYGPLLAKNTHKQRLYGCGHEDLSLRMLALCGFGDGTGEDGWEVATHWDSPLPNDDQSTAQLVTAAKQAGMSDHFICELLEQDYDTEMEYRADEQKEAARAAMQGQAFPQTPPLSPQPQQMSGAGASNGQPSGLSTPGQPLSAPGAAPQQPPMNHPAAVRARQAAQIAAGKKPTPGGMKQ